MARLSWISDSDLQNAVDQLVEQTNNAKRDADERMKKNVIDPFLSLVLASTFDVDTREELVSTQQLSSALRGIGNALGTFHHQILSSVDGWIDYDAGYDIENANRRILAEIKNKHNTMDSKSRRATIQGLETTLDIKRGWKAYLVIIVPKKPRRYRNQIVMRRPVYEIDGASFYEGVTGDPNALRDLFAAVIDIFNSDGQKVPNGVISYCHEVFDTYMPRVEPSLSKVQL